MQHDSPSEESPTLPRASRVGLALFGVYVLLYTGFITLVLVRPDLVALRPFGGINVAVTCGLGLIVAAVLLAAAFLFAPSSRA